MCTCIILHSQACLRFLCLRNNAAAFGVRHGFVSVHLPVFFPNLVACPPRLPHQWRPTHKKRAALSRGPGSLWQARSGGTPDRAAPFGPQVLSLELDEEDEPEEEPPDEDEPVTPPDPPEAEVPPEEEPPLIVLPDEDEPDPLLPVDPPRSLLVRFLRQLSNSSSKDLWRS